MIGADAGAPQAFIFTTEDTEVAQRTRSGISVTSVTPP